MLKLSRRSFLRGAGVAIGLPALEATAWAQAAGAPTRLITFFVPNGIPLQNLVPAQTGPGYTLTTCLQPLAEHRGDFTLVTGVNGSVYLNGLNGHAVGVQAFASGMSCTPRGSGGPSVEQVAARRKGSSTRFSSLAVGVSYNTNASLSDISWAGTDQLVPAERDPGKLFTRLFGAGAPTGGSDPGIDFLARGRKSVLDFVAADINRLKPKLGAGDRTRLDAHLAGVRELEKQVVSFTPATCSVPAKAPTLGPGHTAKARLQMDLIVMALQCGLTNYVSFAYAAGAANGGADGNVGLTGHQHVAAHAGDIPVMTKFSTAHMDALAYFLRKMKAVDEGGHSLLYNSIVYAGTELGNGTAHDLKELPVILAGNASGRFKPGQHIKRTDKPAVSRVLLKVLHLAGIEEPTFGQEAGKAPTTQPLDI